MGAQDKTKDSRSSAQTLSSAATARIDVRTTVVLSEPDSGSEITKSHLQSSKREKISCKQRPINQAVLDLYLCPERFVDLQLVGELSGDSGYFRFGPNTICYGRSAAGFRSERADAPLHDALRDAAIRGAAVDVSFDPNEVIENLRLERYVNGGRGGAFTAPERALKDIYYFFRPLMPIVVRKHLQRAHLRGWRNLSFPRWPVDTTVDDLCEQLLLLSMKAQGADKVPFIWFWPDGAKSCAVLTHDIETERGRNFCAEVMDIDDSFGFKSSFQVVPEGRYEVRDTFLRSIRERGFEINVQDLNHDGDLFRDAGEFKRRARKINDYAKAFGASGFRAAALYRNLDWQSALQFSFDMSVPNVAHLDPQKGGCCTVVPYFFGDTLEIPVTTTQDYMLFHLLEDYSLELWKQQINLIVTKNGLASFIIHPDYVIEQRARRVYYDLLTFLRELRKTQTIWFALPGEINRWWRARQAMRIVGQEGKWRIEGEGAERAVLAFARTAGNHLIYELNH